MSQTKPLAVVLGATGYQGNPTAIALLETGNYRVRAVSRDTTQSKMQHLASLGAELAVADYNDPSSLDVVFKDAFVIFAITNYHAEPVWSVETEYKQGNNIIDAAAKAVTLDHFVFSSMPHSLYMAEGKFQKITHHHANPANMAYLEQTYPELLTKTTELLVQMYHTNWIYFAPIFAPQKQSDGTYLLTRPVAERAIVPVVATHQTGDVVVALLNHPQETKGKPVTFEVEVLSQTELLKTWGEVLGVKTAYKELSPQEYEKSVATGTAPILGPNAPIIAQFLTELFNCGYIWLMARGVMFRIWSKLETFCLLVIICKRGGSLSPKRIGLVSCK